MSRINELDHYVNNLRDKLNELYEYLAKWEVMMPSLQSEHHQLLELM